jgi:hypothetical protein
LRKTFVAKQGGRRECRRSGTRGPFAKCARGSHHGSTEKHPAFPAHWLNGFLCNTHRPTRSPFRLLHFSFEFHKSSGIAEPGEIPGNRQGRLQLI